MVTEVRRKRMSVEMREERAVVEVVYEEEEDIMRMYKFDLLQRRVSH